MKINIPKVITAVAMNEYAAALEGQALHVWVNPPRQLLDEYNQLVTDLQSQELEKAKQLLETPAEAKKNGLQIAFQQARNWIEHKKNQPADDRLDVRMIAWYANLWSQGPADTHWSVDELQELENADPAFLAWMITVTWRARKEHNERKKKV